MEDYKKKYEEALEIARKINSGEGVETPSDYTICETIFPELKESEDERIRKALIHYFSEQDGILTAINGNVSVGDILAWLEKQSKQNPTNKFEPKFKAGDYIINEHGFIMKIDGIYNNTYIYHVLDNTDKKLTYDITKTDKSCHLWTIQDAKDGDVIAFDNGTIVIFKDLYNATTFHSYCHIKNNIFTISKDDMPNCWEGKGFHPATKKQRELLFQKIVEKGYIWDFEKKELSKIKQKSNWNEEDEKHYQGCLNLMKLSLDTKPYPYYNDYLWLKSLKARYTWKPSNEQIRPLGYAIDYFKKKKNDTTYLESLYKDLKKLVEE